MAIEGDYLIRFPLDMTLGLKSHGRGDETRSGWGFEKVPS